MSNNTENTMIALLAGAVIGAGIGILLAPEEGSETRKKLKDNLGKGKDGLMEKYHELTELLHRKATNAGEDIGEFLDSAISSGTHEKDELISLLEEKLALLKKGPAKKQQQLKQQQLNKMAFEELKESTGKIQEETKAYVESTVQYYKLWGFQLVMKSIRTIVKFILLGFFLMLALLFGSIAAALAIGNAIHSLALGFLIVAGAYFVLILLIYFIRFRFVERPILRKFSKQFFNN